MVIFINSAVLSPISRLYFLLTYWTIASSILSPAVLTDWLYTIPESDITATSVVPPPISTIMLPMGSLTGSPAPIAAAMGSSIRYMSLAPASMADSLTALFSTGVMPEGTETITLGLI